MSRSFLSMWLLKPAVVEGRPEEILARKIIHMPFRSFVTAIITFNCQQSKVVQCKDRLGTVRTASLKVEILRWCGPLSALKSFNDFMPNL